MPRPPSLASTLNRGSTPPAMPLISARRDGSYIYLNKGGLLTATNAAGTARGIYTYTQDADSRIDIVNSVGVAAGPYSPAIGIRLAPTELTVRSTSRTGGALTSISDSAAAQGIDTRTYGQGSGRRYRNRLLECPASA
jgi:hypothetical protein